MSSLTKGRAEQKLQYAEINLKELESYPNLTSNDDWENAHQESIFFHLTGAVEALLHEINEGYSLGMELWKVDWTNIERKLKKKNLSSLAFNHLYQLKRKDETWLALLYRLRNYSGHSHKIRKQLSVAVGSASKIPDNKFKDPKTGDPQNILQETDCMNILKRFIEEVRKLVDKCRRDDPNL